MWQDNELKIKLYLYPIFMFALGSWALLSPGWEVFGGLLFVLGFVVSIHIILVSVIREGRYHIEAEDRRLEEQRKLYETVMRMDGEARYAFGLGYVPKEVLVKVDKTAVEQNEFSQIWRKLPIVPYKLKVIAQSAINGEGFTVRKWAGDGKLLSRLEWDAMLESMLELKMIEYVDEEHPTLGTNWTGLGMDVMSQVVKDTL